MQDLERSMLAADIERARSLVFITKLFKISAAILVLLAYFLEADWLLEAMIVGLVLTLIIPMGFFDVFIQKLLEYNTQNLEARQKLNVQEANEHFGKLYQKVSEDDD